MSTQAEAADQVVRIMLDGSEHAIRIAGAGAKRLAMLLYAILKDQKRTKGKVRLTNMLRSGKELRIFPVKTEELQKFCKEAKKYGVLYCALRQKNAKDGVVDIMARAEDASKIGRIFERLQLSDVDVASVRSEVVKAKDAPATNKEVPERVVPEKDPADLFVEELFAPAPNKEQMHTANPTLATGSTNRSAPTSKKSKAQAYEPERMPLAQKPSVREKLEALRREQQTGRKKTEPERIQYPEHKPPKKKRKEKNR